MKSTVLLICLAAAVCLLAAAESKSEEQGKDTASQKRNASDTFIGKEAGQVRDDNALKMKLVWCSPGFVTMEYVEEPNDAKVESKGLAVPESRQADKITLVKTFLSKGYWLGKYEVTQSEWKQVMQTEPWKGMNDSREGADFPATFVSWDEAKEFCRKLTEYERQAGRLAKSWEYTLPTEAQWERACRARTETRFSFGDDESKLGDFAWFGDNTSGAGEPYAHPVGQKKSNPWGLHDMHGNVWEWCRDSYTGKLPGGRDPEVKTDKKTGTSNPVYRGGCWRSLAARCCSADRFGLPPSYQHDYLGFRVAVSSVQSAK